MATPLPPPQKPPGDCDGCGICAKSFRTLQQQKQPEFSYKRLLSELEAKRFARIQVTSIVDDWKASRKLIEHHEDLIQERWQRRTMSERHETIKSAIQGRELQQELNLWSESPNQKMRLPLEALLLNHLTMNRLTAEPNTLLVFLRARTSLRPSTWLLSDNKRIEWFWSSGVKVYFSKFLMNIDADSDECYLLSKSPDAPCRQRLKIGFPRAILLLAFQKTIMSLLKNVAQILIGEAFPEGKPLLESFWGFEPKYASSDREFCCSYLNEPFTEPRIFRDSCIRSITLRVRMRYDLVTDHLHFLQTHSDNLHQTILETAVAMGPDTTNIEDVIGQTVSALSYDIWNYWSWRSILFECERLEHLGTTLRNSSRQSKEAAGIEFEAIVHELSVLLDEQSKVRASNISRLLSSRATFSKYFVRQRERSVRGVSLTKAVLDGAQVARQDYLFHILWEISKIPSLPKPTKVDLDTAFALLNKLKRQCSGQKDRIDDTLYSCLSDLAATHDIQAKLEIRPPLAHRASVKKFLDDLLDCQTSLGLDDLKVRDNDFKDFTLAGFDRRCEALLRFLKVARLEQPKQLAGKDLSQATISMHWFWLEMREKRLSMLQCTAQKIGVHLSKEYIGNDLGRIFDRDHLGHLLSELEDSADELDLFLATDIEFDADPFGMLANNHPKAGCRSECLAPTRSQAWTLWTQTSLPAVAAFSIEKLPVNRIGCAQLVEVNVPIKESFWAIFELAAGFSQTPILWKTFVTFMDEVLGFQAWETYFDCSFVPRFHKRVFVGKGNGNNISSWKHQGAIILRNPAKGILDRCTLITSFERLGTLFAKNGIRVTFQREATNTKFDENGEEIVNWNGPRRTKPKPCDEPDPSNSIGHNLAENGPLWETGMPKPEGFFIGYLT